MGKDMKNSSNDYFFDAILELKNKDECYAFFSDICTVNELQAFAQRFEVASLLRCGRTYVEIAEETGASTATISRVNRSLNYGNDAYDMLFSRIGSFTDCEKKDKKEE